MVGLLVDTRDSSVHLRFAQMFSHGGTTFGQTMQITKSREYNFACHSQYFKYSGNMPSRLQNSGFVVQKRTLTMEGTVFSS